MAVRAPHISHSRWTSWCAKRCGIWVLHYLTSHHLWTRSGRWATVSSAIFFYLVISLFFRIALDIWVSLITEFWSTKTEAMITSRISLDEMVDKGFKTLLEHRDQHCKILVVVQSWIDNNFELLMSVTIMIPEIFSEPRHAFLNICHLNCLAVVWVDYTLMKSPIHASIHSLY